jgi:adenylosuccinate lyase
LCSDNTLFSHVEKETYGKEFREKSNSVNRKNITSAAGTFAGFGKHGFEVQELTLKKLGLDVPEICWYEARDRFGKGLINTENVMMALSVFTGKNKNEAHHILFKIATTAWKEDKYLEEVLSQSSIIRDHFSAKR